VALGRAEEAYGGFERVGPEGPPPNKRLKLAARVD